MAPLDASLWNDFLAGNDGANKLDGGDGKDTLSGGLGADNIIGGLGIDLLSGGGGADTFRFAAGDLDLSISYATAERITDFNHAESDRINLSAIDAVAGGADNAFAFIGSAAFSGVAGQLRAQVINGSTFVSGDTNGDSVADFYLKLDGAPVLVAGDFVL